MTFVWARTVGWRGRGGGWGGEERLYWSTGTDWTTMVRKSVSVLLVHAIWSTTKLRPVIAHLYWISDTSTCQVASLVHVRKCDTKKHEKCAYWNAVRFYRDQHRQEMFYVNQCRQERCGQFVLCVSGVRTIWHFQPSRVEILGYCKMFLVTEELRICVYIELFSWKMSPLSDQPLDLYCAIT